MTEKELTELVKAIGKACGFRDKENGFFRDNKKAENGARYFGFISKGNNAEADSVTGTENTESGRYWDFSLVFFPEVDGVKSGKKNNSENSDEDDSETKKEVKKDNLKSDGKGIVKSFLVSLGVGTNGFAFDQNLATRPGTRRHFLRLHTEEEKEKQFFKNDFTDITTNLVKEVKDVKPKIGSQYCSLLQAGQYVDISSSNKEEEENEIINVIENLEGNKDEKSKINKLNNHKLLTTICRWTATYAKMRDWGTASNKSVIEKLLPTSNKKTSLLMRYTIF